MVTRHAVRRARPLARPLDGDPRGGALVAVLAVLGSGWPGGQHHRLPGRAQLRPRGDVGLRADPQGPRPRAPRRPGWSTGSSRSRRPSTAASCRTGRPLRSGWWPRCSRRPLPHRARGGRPSPPGQQRTVGSRARRSAARPSGCAAAAPTRTEPCGSVRRGLLGWRCRWCRWSDRLLDEVDLLELPVHGPEQEVRGDRQTEEDEEPEPPRTHDGVGQLARLSLAEPPSDGRRRQPRRQRAVSAVGAATRMPAKRSSSGSEVSTRDRASW